jgi:hypothetical protein
MPVDHRQNERRQDENGSTCVTCRFALETDRNPVLVYAGPEKQDSLQDKNNPIGRCGKVEFGEIDQMEYHAGP